MWRGVWVGILSVVLIAGLASQSVASYFNATEQNSSNVFSTVQNWPEILRPDGVGNSTENTPYGASDNWQCVDEDPSDEDSTYVQCDAISYLKDAYALQDHSVGSGTIDNVKISIKCRRAKSVLEQNVYAKIAVRTHDTDYEGTEVSLPDSYAVYATEYSVNPYTDNAWTWEEIDNLQCGVSLKSTLSGSWDYARCTQIWVTVFYTP